ncbi:DUF1415 domain-containing protein [Rudaea cellulosilytica]|uniref:DUF1415 domain-containing protein n=1 Tax=Rudaea cellulosilytica TaxID=540746 RepID=UPI00035DA60C|nr:DUF1415 domain-containing protein [Rudaea cellulosilytica]
MNTPASQTNSTDANADADVIRVTEQWIARAVIGLNLCPFARAPLAQQRVRFCVSHADNEDALLDDLCEELVALQNADPQICETTLLIHPHVLTEFLDYNDFLGAAETAVQVLGLEGELQVASFHPGYQFADTDADTIENCTNRSPYPILHLLRESSIERALESIFDPDEIHRRNIATLRKLGRAGWQALMGNDSGAK